MKEKAYLGDFSQVKEKVFAWVMNRDFYDALLEKVPHRDFLDLSVVYSLVLEDDPEQLCFIMVWNKAGRFGANVLLHPEILERLAERIEDDFYILPSSMDEVLAVPTRRNMAAKELAEIVCAVNENNLPPEEQLSNQVYFYKRGSGEVVMAA